MALKLAFAIGSLLISMGMAVAGEPERLTYKGLPLGATMAEFQAKLPDYQCKEKTCTYDRERCGGRLAGITKEATDAYSERLKQCNERTSFGGALATYAFVYFEEGGLANLSLTIPSSHMETLADTVAQKFGKATQSNEEPFRNRAGGQFPNWERTWKIGDDYLVLTLRLGRVDEGAAQLTSGAQMRAVLLEQAKKVKQGAKDF